MEKEIKQILKIVKGNSQAIKANTKAIANLSNKVEDNKTSIENLARLTADFIADRQERDKVVDSKFDGMNHRLYGFAEHKANRVTVLDLDNRVTRLEEKLLHG